MGHTRHLWAVRTSSSPAETQNKGQSTCHKAHAMTRSPFSVGWIIYPKAVYSYFAHILSSLPVCLRTLALVAGSGGD